MGRPAHRLIRLLDEASPDDWQCGLDWYAGAYALACRLWDSTPQGASVGAGIIAALSPRCQWVENIRRAIMVTQGRITGLKHPAAKAQRIWQGQPPDQVLRGPKERAFYLAILSQGLGLTPAVIDVWAARAAGLRQPRNLAEYEKLSQLYAEVARRGNPRHTVHQVQAVIWVTYRRRYLAKLWAEPCESAWDQAMLKLPRENQS